MYALGCEQAARSVIFSSNFHYCLCSPLPKGTSPNLANTDLVYVDNKSVTFVCKQVTPLNLHFEERIRNDLQSNQPYYTFKNEFISKGSRFSISSDTTFSIILTANNHQFEDSFSRSLPSFACVSQ